MRRRERDELLLELLELLESESESESESLDDDDDDELELSLELSLELGDRLLRFFFPRLDLPGLLSSRDSSRGRRRSSRGRPSSPRLPGEDASPPRASSGSASLSLSCRRRGDA